MSRHSRLSGNTRQRRVAGGVLATAALAAVAIASAGANEAASTDPMAVVDEPPANQLATLDGTPDARLKASPGNVDLGTILPSAEFRGASFEAAGVGLRNQLQGGITISGVKGRPIKTFVYWAIITNSTDGARQPTLRISRTSSPSSVAPATTVAGKVVGSGPSPCWGGDVLTVYRGTVSPSVATGNGTYDVRPTPRGSSINGDSPWPVLVAPPYLEGASLVMIYPELRSSVSVFDAGIGGAPALSGSMFYGTSNHVLERNIAARHNTALFAEIGADGQTGSGHDGFAAGEVTRLNGVDVAGGKSGKGSDWDGDDGNPLAQLWDTHVHDVDASPGASADEVEVEAGSDCLTHIADVIAG